MAEPRRIGVFGGTFDPIHAAHLAVAQAALTQARLDEVLFVVAAIPPHKQHAVRAGAEDRYAMVAAAVEALHEPRFTVSRIELDREGLSYTSDTLREIQAANPDAELFLIIGADALGDLPGWHDPTGILRAARLLVVPRPGFSPEDVPELAGRFQLLHFDEVPVSSTGLRAHIAAGKGTVEDLPPAVAAIIRERGLYRGTAAGNA